MELALILVKKVAVMFMLLATGITLKKVGIMNEEHARAMSNVLLMVVIPAQVLRSFQRERMLELIPAMLVMMALAAFVHILSIAIANLTVRDPGDNTTAWRVSKLSIVFSNAGFMGFPLIEASVGHVGLLYGAVYTGILNVVRWVWSVPALTGGKRMPVKKLLTNSTIICFFVGWIMFLMNVQLSGVLETFVDDLASMNTPLSMLVVGVFLATVKPLEALTDKRVYQVLFLRNIFIPLVVLGVLCVLNISAWLPEGKILALALLVMVACPSGASSIMMPARYHCDGHHGAKIVTISTLVSIITMPLIVAMGDYLL